MLGVNNVAPGYEAMTGAYLIGSKAHLLGVRQWAGLMVFLLGVVPPVQADARTLYDAIAEAWSKEPGRANFQARQATADAKYRAGGALVPNAPTAAGSYVNDRIAGSNYNYITSQVQVSTPVWLPGEGTATQHAAQAEATAASASAEAAHLDLAKQVISLVASARLAADARDVAARQLTIDQTLSRDLQRQVSVGETAQSDQLAADAETASATIRLNDAQAQLEAALIQLAAVTGSRELPSLSFAALPATTGANAIAGNPRLAAAEQAVTAARARAKLVEIQDRDDPEIGLEGINEKQPGTRWDTRFGVTFTFHFATEARNAPRRAEAEQAVTEAIVQAALVRRELIAALQLAEATKDNAARAVQAAERGAAALDRRRVQIEQAWRLGEMPFIEFLRANVQALDADLARRRARTSLQLAQVQLAIAAGVIP